FRSAGAVRGCRGATAGQGRPPPRGGRSFVSPRQPPLPRLARAAPAAGAASVPRSWARKSAGMRGRRPSVCVDARRLRCESAQRSVASHSAPEEHAPPERRSTRVVRQAGGDAHRLVVNLRAAVLRPALVPQVIAGETDEPPSAIRLAGEGRDARFAAYGTCGHHKWAVRPIGCAATAAARRTTVAYATLWCDLHHGAPPFPVYRTRAAGR